MTVIAYRDGVMAADSASFVGELVLPWVAKVARGADGSLYGTTGDCALTDEFLRCVREDRVGEAPKPTMRGESDTDFTVLISRPNGELRWLCGNGEEVYDGAPYLAVGAGMQIASGAFWMGATAEQAVEACLQHSLHARGAVQAVRR